MIFSDIIVSMVQLYKGQNWQIKLFYNCDFKPLICQKTVSFSEYVVLIRDIFTINIYNNNRDLMSTYSL